MALESYKRVECANKENRFKEPILPLGIKTRKGIQVFERRWFMLKNTTIKGVGCN